jgi:dihydrofolate reductase
VTEPLPQITLVVATDLDGVIGHDNRMPWHLPADLARFKSITMGKPMIMGRRTWESIGRPLPGRRSIVLTRARAFAAPGAEIAHTPEEALALAAPAIEVMIIGGAEVFRLFLPRADRIHWTQVMGRVPGNVRFPALDLTQWRDVRREDLPADERNAFATQYRVLERIRR